MDRLCISRHQKLGTHSPTDMAAKDAAMISRPDWGLLMVFADALHRRRDQYKIVLLDNATEIPFITGDQPIFNIHTTFHSGIAPERLERFYTLSPTRATAQ